MINGCMLQFVVADAEGIGINMLGKGVYHHSGRSICSVSVKDFSQCVVRIVYFNFSYLYLVKPSVRMIVIHFPAQAVKQVEVHRSCGSGRIESVVSDNTAYKVIG